MPLVGKGKKKQITGTFTVTMSSLFLPMQRIYEGKSPRSLLQGIMFPENFDLTLTPNHWRRLLFRFSWRNAKSFPFLMSRRLSKYLTCSKDRRRSVFKALLPITTALLFRSSRYDQPFPAARLDSEWSRQAV